MTLYRITALALAATGFTTAAYGQSSLGFNQLTASVSWNEHQQNFHGSMDFNVTHNHGLQLDLDVNEYGDTMVGGVVGHLYMVPDMGQKYGLWGSYHDLNDDDVSYLTGGIEGMFEISDRAFIEGRLGFGEMSGVTLDYIFVELGATYALSDDWSVNARAMVAEYDESWISALGITAELSVQHALSTVPGWVEAGVRHTAINGDFENPSDTSFFIAASFTLGGSNSANRGVEQRTFRMSDPIAPLWQHGLIKF